MSDFLMPSLGADMEAGTLLEWLVTPGQEVQPGDIIAVVETQKRAIETEIFELLVGEGTKVPVGTTIARVGKTMAKPAAIASHEPAKATSPAATTQAAVATSLAVAPRPSQKAGARVSPAARALSAQLGVGLDGLSGSGPAGSVASRDVRRAAVAMPAKTPSQEKPRPARGLDLDTMRFAIAAAMV